MALHAHLHCVYSRSTSLSFNDNSFPVVVSARIVCCCCFFPPNKFWTEYCILLLPPPPHTHTRTHSHSLIHVHASSSFLKWSVCISLINCSPAVVLSSNSSKCFRGAGMVWVEISVRRHFNQLGMYIRSSLTIMDTWYLLEFCVARQW